MHRPLHVCNVLFTPNIIKNHISVHCFTTDNLVSIEFDPCGFSVKDLKTRQLLLKCDSSDDLYPVIPSTQVALLCGSTSLWHQRLGNPGAHAFNHLVSNKLITRNKCSSTVSCQGCQIGKSIRLPFEGSNIIVSGLFDIVHSDLWLSPVESISGINYYIIFLDHYSPWF